MQHDEIPPEKNWMLHRGRRPAIYKGPVVLVGLVLAIWLAIELKELLTALVFSITLASAIAPIAEYSEKKWKISRAITVVLVFGLIGVVYSFLVVALFPTLQEQALSLYDNLPRYTDGINHLYNHMRELLGENVGNFTVGSAEIKSFVSKASSHALHLTSDLFTVIATGILVMFLTAYFVVEANVMWPKLLEWLPTEKRERAAQLIRPLESRLGGYIRGQLLVSVVVSIFLMIGLSLLQVDHALLLGALSGLLNLVPFVGSLITAALSLLVAFNQSPQLAAEVLVLFALEQYCESNLIVPNLLGKQVELHPLIVLFAILIGATLLGVAGALIAVPLATAGTFLAQEFYLKPLKQKERKEASLLKESPAEPVGEADDSYAQAAAILSATRLEPNKVKLANQSKKESGINIEVADLQKQDHNIE